jgi:hypothetical protein
MLDRPLSRVGDVLQRHLGICYDVCHGSVGYEDPVAALDRLIGAGIAIRKIKLSAAMRVRAMTNDLVGAVMRHDDGVHLHQTIAREIAFCAKELAG